jgi:hypothetical protein
MSSSRRRFLVLLPLLVLLLGFRQAPLVDPPPIDVPHDITLQNVSKAIEISLLRRGWTAANKTADGMDGILHLREHTAQIHIAFDASKIEIKYVSSTNLKFEEAKGERQIHKNYLGWIQNLVLDIKANLIVLAG